MLLADTMAHTAAAHDTIAEVLARWPGSARVLVDRGMHCVGCPIAPFETVAKACAIYGVPVEQLLVDLTLLNAGERREQP